MSSEKGSIFSFEDCKFSNESKLSFPRISWRLNRVSILFPNKNYRAIRNKLMRKKEDLSKFSRKWIKILNSKKGNFWIQNFFLFWNLTTNSIGPFHRDLYLKLTKKMIPREDLWIRFSRKKKKLNKILVNINLRLIPNALYCLKQ